MKDSSPQTKLKESLDKVKNNSPVLEYAYGTLNKSEETRLFEQIMSSVIADKSQESAKQYDNTRKDPNKGQYITPQFGISNI